MPLEFKCPACQAALRVKDEHAGKKMKCPKCAKVIAIPEKQAEEVFEDVEVVDEEAAESAGDPFDFDSDAPAPKKGAVKSKEPDRPKGKTWGKYMPCPNCGGREAKRLKWTWWGSYYGPRIFNHVRCVDCGFAFNGKTGDSNMIPMILCVAIPLVFCAIALFFLYVALVRTGYWPPWKLIWQ
jgi:predicted Zn finger-like uncharacterized protein